MIHDGPELLTIGQLASRTGLPVRTIRYWSDAGALPVVDRSPGNYRLYDAASVARLELIRTLRDLGLGLDDVRAVVGGEITVAQVAARHVSALDAQIRSLKVTRAVLTTVAKRGSSAEEMTLMNKLARLSAAERKRIIDTFTAEVFGGLDTTDPDIRTRLQFGIPDLPDDPTVDQVDAWVEMAELLQDPEFRRGMRKVIEFNAAGRTPKTPPGTSLWFMSRLVHLAGDARGRGIAPASQEARDVLGELLGDADRGEVLERMLSASQADVSRLRDLIARVRGLEESPQYREEFAWVVAALEAELGR
ncbi:MerR family transcriptional regulator [Streptomyces sp. TRM66268-LWL]|uniref:MerR family transcriptional regulator n=1 Tax=Streptomyces polyasparticus TaxID=2767826 RepID=A0ABR7S7L7_9ACTN|nr:MerR family transcriptional regulator [Streptomyces polyasparticus]MBC9711466.1 MerR family transcriptional regulator [Streptomyces polyasparticus]